MAESQSSRVVPIFHSTFCFQVSSEFSSQLVLNSQLREDLEVLQIGHDHYDQLYKHLEQVGLGDSWGKKVGDLVPLWGWSCMKGKWRFCYGILEGGCLVFTPA